MLVLLVLLVSGPGGSKGIGAVRQRCFRGLERWGSGTRESACRLRDMLVMVRMDGACVDEEGTGFWGEAGRWCARTSSGVRD